MDFIVIFLPAVCWLLWCTNVTHQIWCQDEWFNVFGSSRECNLGGNTNTSIVYFGNFGKSAAWMDAICHLNSVQKVQHEAISVKNKRHMTIKYFYCEAGSGTGPAIDRHTVSLSGWSPWMSWEHLGEKSLVRGVPSPLRYSWARHFTLHCLKSSSRAQQYHTLDRYPVRVCHLSTVCVRARSLHSAETVQLYFDNLQFKKCRRDT